MDVTIPKSSFVAYRLTYADLVTVSENAKCVLLGGIPEVWNHLHETHGFGPRSKHVKATYHRFKDTMNTINHSIRSGYMSRDDDSIPDNVFSRSNRMFSSKMKKELTRLRDWVDSDSLDDDEPEHDAFDDGVASIDTSHLDEPRPLVVPVSQLLPNTDSHDEIKKFGLEPMTGRVRSQLESGFLSETLLSVSSDDLEPGIPSKVAAAPHVSIAEPTRKPRISVIVPEPSQQQFASAQKEHAQFRKKIRKLARATRGRAKDTTHSIQSRLFKAILQNYRAGEIVRLDRMLVIIKETSQRVGSASFTEIEPCDTRVVLRWEEFLVVLRKTDNSARPFVLQLYDMADKTRGKPQHQVPLAKDTECNFYLTTDKSVAITVPKDNGLVAYIFKSRFQLSAFKWIYLLKQILKYDLDPSFNIYLVGLHVKMQLKIPQRLILLLTDPTDSIRLQVLPKGYRVEHSRVIEYIKSLILGHLEEKRHVLPNVDKWLVNNPNPWFCYKFYDRLDWILNNSEFFYIQQQLLSKTFQLQFREMVQEPRVVTVEDTCLSEPYPIEGFLSRLTNTLGKEVSFLRTFHKMSYFYTADHLLFFTTYFRGLPPTEDSTIPLVEIADANASLPEVFVKSPFELDENNHIPWLGSPDFAKHDAIALAEFERRTQQIAKAEGLLDLCLVKTVAPIPSDKVLGPHKLLHCVLWYASAQMVHDEEIVDSAFEIVLTNGSSVKLQAPNRKMRDEWVRRLTELSVYWRAKKADNLNRKIAVRNRNRQTLKINEYVDSNVVQASDTIEYVHSTANPHLHNIGSLAMAHPVLMSGYLFLKHKKHANFAQYFVVLCPGFLLMFTLFRRSKALGMWKKSSYFDHYLTIPLADSYIYSGNSTALDLLRRQREFDPQNPGHHLLPRLYADGWISAEEEPIRCFTLWYGHKRHIAGETNLESTDSNTHDMPKNPGLVKMIRKLGMTGKSLVFMARSRQEREKWVSRIYTEVDRFAKE